MKQHPLISVYQTQLISSVQLLSWIQLFVTPWTAAPQASLSITNSQSLLKLLSIESVMPSNHLILYFYHETLVSMQNLNGKLLSKHFWLTKNCHLSFCHL